MASDLLNFSYASTSMNNLRKIDAFSSRLFLKLKWLYIKIAFRISSSLTPSTTNRNSLVPWDNYICISPYLFYLAEYVICQNIKFYLNLLKFRMILSEILTLTRYQSLNISPSEEVATEDSTSHTNPPTNPS